MRRDALRTIAGGGVASQAKWFEDAVNAWNASHDPKIELVYVPNNAYMDGTKLPTAFASGSGGNRSPRC